MYSFLTSENDKSIENQEYKDHIYSKYGLI